VFSTIDGWFPAAAAAVIFALTYLAVALGRLPGLRTDRAGAAFVGASLMVAAGAISLPDAYRAIDLDTIALLLGMMIVVANLRLAGFFALVAAWSVRRAGRPLLLLAAVVLIAGLLSAFLVNDTVCLVLTPLVLEIVLRLRRDPVPYMLAIAMASNIGSVATITGNPQNMIIGSVSGIAYRDFAAALAPVAAIGLGLTFGLIALAWRREFAAGPISAEAPAARVNRPLLYKSMLVTALLVIAFFAGIAPPRAAIAAGGVLLLTRRLKPQRFYAEIDWTLLLMFAGLFVVVAGLQHTLLTPEAVARLGGLHLDRTPVLTLITAVLSNLVSNVPAVLVLRPFIEHLADPAHAWLVVAMASTLAGNFTILGSVANLIVVERARARGVEISFGTYFRVGAPLTLMTLLAGILLV
jgi:Na+/H+ antiporter NhaD/arsenite permease-like protein